MLMGVAPRTDNRMSPENLEITVAHKGKTATQCGHSAEEQDSLI